MAWSRLLPGVRELIDEIHVAHYEVLDEDSEPVMGGASDGAAAGEDAAASDAASG